MFTKKSFFVLFYFFLFQVITMQNLFGCSCGGGKPTVLESFEESESVVIVKIMSMEKIRKKRREHDVGYIRSIKAVVEKVYKGKTKVGDELIFGQGDDISCVIIFREDWIGDKLLFYLGKPTKGYQGYEDDPRKYKIPMYFVTYCGRSNFVSAAKDDLSYLDNLDALRGKTRISGTLSTRMKGGPSFANIKVKIIGKDKTYETQTDQKGFFEIYDLPAGGYLIEPDIPKGWKTEGWGEISEHTLKYIASNNPPFYELIKKASKTQTPLILEDRRHAGGGELKYEIDNSVRGKVFSPDGKPMAGVCVRAVSTELPAGNYSGMRGCTNERGEFEITEIYPGNYNLVVNDDGKISSEEPFGRLFYPGVTEQSKAGVVSVDVGTFVNDIDVRVPKVEPLIEISGRFIYSDGKPVSGKWVEFKPTKKNGKIDGGARGLSDERGQFSLKILKGVAGKISGEMTIYESDFEGCPHVTKLIKVIGQKSWEDVKTQVLRVNGDKDLYNVELKLPFASCPKAKK